MLYQQAKKFFGKEKFLVISPDEGASYFTENAQGHVLKKKRKESNHTGKNETEIYAHIHEIDGDIDVKNKNLAILDDVISTGSTMMKTIEHLISLGAKKIIIGSTHGVFAGDNIAKKILESGCEKIFITDSVLNGHQKNITILSLPENK